MRYGEGTPLFLPRTLGEAEIAVERVLAPILSYDDAHNTELLGSLSVFLEQNRSWQRSAELLHVHKQTLVYRMRRVEELTGRDLRETARRRAAVARAACARVRPRRPGRPRPSAYSPSGPGQVEFGRSVSRR